LAAVDGKLELLFESAALGRARREIAKVVEPAFTYRNHAAVRVQLGKHAQRVTAELDGPVWMHAGGGVEHTRPLLGQRSRLDAAGLACAGNDHAGHAGLTCCLDYGTAVGV